MKERRVGKLLFHIDLSQPLYEQVLDQMRSSVAKGVIGLGEKIPSVREMAQDLQVNPNTVMRAYQELDRDGLIEKRRGQGTFITTEQKRVHKFRTHLARSIVEDFITKMHSLGYSTDDIETLLRKNTRDEKGRD